MVLMIFAASFGVSFVIKRGAKGFWMISLRNFMICRSTLNCNCGWEFQNAVMTLPVLQTFNITASYFYWLVRISLVVEWRGGGFVTSCPKNERWAFGSFMTIKPTLSCSHWWEFVHTECCQDIITSERLFCNIATRCTTNALCIVDACY